jgi:Na+-transporting NADH:ubiquinone oxidoreductase subunit C
MANDTVGKTIAVAALLCIVCSVLVSTATVKLKPLQESNKAQFTRTNILKAAGILEAGTNIDALFKNIEAKYVNLETGEFDNEFNPATYDQKLALKNPQLSQAITKENDLANIKRRVKIAEVYLVKKDGELDAIVLPVYGKGLWSTMYAFLALERDGNTIRGYSFYDHGETPGLGGEVDNPLWQAKWKGKKLYDSDLNLAITVLKGKVNGQRPEAIHQVDGLSGATLTTNGVKNLMRYWLGDNGFEKFLSKIRMQGVENG